MENRKLWALALTVPFAIVAIVWAIAGVYLFQTPPPLHQIATQVPKKESEHVARPGRKSEKILAVFSERRQAYSTPQGYPGGFAPPGMAPTNGPSTANEPDYLDAVNTEGNFRWSPDKLPIDVYIADGYAVSGYQPGYRQMMVDAFNAWCDSSSGTMSWREVQNPNKSDVMVSWTSSPNIRPGAVEAGQTKTLVQQNKLTGDGKIMNAQISILTELMGRPFNEDAMRKTCLHEVGHALGLQGHSDVPTDIMYPTVNEHQVARLKARDVNTLARLYSTGARNTVASSTRSSMMKREFADDDGIVPFDNSDLRGQSAPYAPPWMNGSRSYVHHGPRFRHGMNREAVMREFMRRAAQQRGWYN
jgi:predicted Zn-dependent protease